uniref:tRNA (adenine(58)-N(1))-methyltransferase catalytic subunit TRMT61A n=1 Tax=Triatoma infestans TaxID=30076 RepID=A0A023F8C2_TRIIF
MSFSVDKEAIEEGDTVILYLNANSMHAIKVTNSVLNKHGENVENVFQTTYGALKVSSLIGTKYGSKVEMSRGWAYVLQPTPELWTLTLPHRTQIIYTPDISMIIYQLEIKPGSYVIESGTGSGSLTHALARRVAPNGFVSTFDFHEHRVNLAKEEFASHGISNIVSVGLRDVCSDGFGEELDGKADAVFLDLPHPWMVIPHAVKALKTAGGRFCSFSPCIEQVQKTCSTLRQAAFTEITTMECLQREINISRRSLPIASLNKEEKLSKENSEAATKGTIKLEENKYNFVSSGYASTMPGHTGYLTFATLPPSWTTQPPLSPLLESSDLS